MDTRSHDTRTRRALDFHTSNVALLQICGGIAGTIQKCQGAPTSTVGQSGNVRFTITPVVKGDVINISKGRWERAYPYMPYIPLHPPRSLFYLFTSVDGADQGVRILAQRASRPRSPSAARTSPSPRVSPGVQTRETSTLPTGRRRSRCISCSRSTWMYSLALFLVGMSVGFHQCVCVRHRWPLP